MTAHYNGYFNAREEIRLALNSYKEGYQEDYTEIIPVFIYPTQERVGDVMQSMDVAIEKTSTVISKNTMPNPEKAKKQKTEEWCKWIDDNWFVMAQANFYKRDYEVAENLLKYIKLTYPTQEVVFHADLWLAKCAIAKADYASALSILEQLEEKMVSVEEGTFFSNPKRLPRNRAEKYDIAQPVTNEAPEVPKNFRADLYQVYADLYLQKGDYKEAVDMLQQAIDFTKKRKMRTRLTFILAQVYHKMDDRTNATASYLAVTKMTPPYEMEFYARIYRVLLYNGGDTRGLRADLNKMIKDEKNVDYLDQIYYALAELDLNEGKKDSGIENLELSARYSKDNKKQKAKTYTRLADLYYDDKAYPKAKIYYDSSLTVIDQEHPNYELISDRRDGLTDLVNNLEIYHFQDSVLNLVNQGERAYMKAIEDLIEAKQKADRERLEAQSNNAFASSGSGSGNTDFGSGAKWYFYNETMKAKGVNDFRGYWGERSLEDNWRRKDKSSLIANVGVDGNDSLTPLEKDPYAVEYYLKNLPLEEEQQDLAHEKIADALYNLGIIYKERLNESDLGMSYFEELVDRYGDTITGLPGMYQLYLGYKSDGNSSSSNIYKNRILNEYPDSEYAKIIRNPNFKKDEEVARKRHNEEYEKTYKMYVNGKYAEVVTTCDGVVSRKEPNAYLPRFLLLKAYALGAQDAENLAAIKVPLEILVNEHTETDEGIKAKSILQHLRNKESLSDVESGSSNFVYNAEMQHFFVLFFEEGSGDIRAAAAKVSDYNSALFRNKKLKTKHTILNKNMRMVVVRSFANANAAMQYYEVFKNDRRYLEGMNIKYKFAVITHKNYAAMVTLRDMADYIAFFTKNYQ